jgi:hypothetical protein
MRQPIRMCHAGHNVLNNLKILFKRDTSRSTENIRHVKRRRLNLKILGDGICKLHFINLHGTTNLTTSC